MRSALPCVVAAAGLVACSGSGAPHRAANPGATTPPTQPDPASTTPPSELVPPTTTAPPTSFRPTADQVQVLDGGNTLVLPLRDYRGPRSRTLVPATLEELRALGIEVATDQWVLADGAEPCLAHPSQVMLDVSEPAACSAVDCEMNFALVTLAGCGPGAVAIAGPSGAATSPRPTWRYLAATTSEGSDLVREDRSTPAYQRKLARYWRRHPGGYADPGFVHRAAKRTEVPARYRHLLASARCGRRCVLTWTVDRLATTPPIEAVTIEIGARAASDRCAIEAEAETVAGWFAVEPTGPVAITAASHPDIADVTGRFRGALIEDGALRMALPYDESMASGCISSER